MDLGPISRPHRCSACRTSFQALPGANGKVACPHCGVEKQLGQLEPATTESALGSDYELQGQTETSTSGWSPETGSTIDEEYRMAPPVKAPVGSSTAEPTGELVAEWIPSSQQPKLTDLDVDSSERDSSDPDPQDLFGRYPSKRHYPTLESLQRLHKTLGYAAVLVVMPYLLLRLVLVVTRSQGNLPGDLIAFSEWAVPTLFATVAIVGLLFGSAEGIKLAMDLQDNTLRLANHFQRRSL